MPLNTHIEMQCDNCGHSDYCLPPKSYAVSYFKDLGYITEEGRWFCDEKCKAEFKRKESEK